MLAYRLGMQLDELNNSYIEKERNSIKQQGQIEALIFSFPPEEEMEPPGKGEPTSALESKVNLPPHGAFCPPVATKTFPLTGRNVRSPGERVGGRCVGRSAPELQGGASSSLRRHPGCPGFFRRTLGRNKR